MNTIIAGKKVSTRDRIVRAAAELLAEGGRDAVSTRSVAAAAGVQAPTIYRQFGDMNGLLDEVASHGFSSYLLDKKTQKSTEDPLEDLRLGWDLHIGFGLANPALYTLMYGNPGPDAAPTAALEAQEILHQLVQRVAEAGRLLVSVESAVDLIHATGVGVVLNLIAIRDEKRNLALSDMAREAILATVTTDKSADSASQANHTKASRHAVALKATLPEDSDVLTTSETALLSDWLDRIIHNSH